MIINIHNFGGGGPFGASGYLDRATGCLEKTRLDAENPCTCDVVYKATATGRPNAMLVGSMVHALAEHELKGSPPEDIAKAEFVDIECGWEIPKEWQKEALRVYTEWAKIRKPLGEIIGAEMLLEQPAEIDLGVPLASKIDLIHQYPDESFLTLTDFKTSSASGDTYSRGRTLVQQWLYCINAWAHGYNIQRLEIRQITKTKTVKENIYELPLPTPLDEAWLMRYIKGALEREKHPMHGPVGPECTWCPYFQKECTL